MDVVLGGYLETGLVRFTDAVIQPSRNATTHPYYLCLNRKVPKTYFDRSATFVALAERVIVPSIDWGGFSHAKLDPADIGVEVNGEEKFGGSEWDNDTVALVNILLDAGALSPESWAHASIVDLSDLPPPQRKAMEPERPQLVRDIGHHYLCRLLLHVRAAGQSGAFLVLSEKDLAIVEEIGAWLLQTRLPTPYSLPDLTGRVISEDFAGGMLNFAPPDVLALPAVKADRAIRDYARKVGTLLGDSLDEAAQRALLKAMVAAHDQAEAGHKAQKVFEIATWVAKPLHYIPGIGEGLTLAEDIKDLIGVWTNRETESREWYLIGVKMTEVAYKDYLSRKDNLAP